MKIIRYKNVNDIDIEFENGYISKNNTYQNFKKGQVRNYLVKQVVGVGCLGNGKYYAEKNDICSPEYICWRNMLIRCYDSKYKEKYPTYETCIACDEWLNFQNFAEWYNCNFYIVNDEKMHLDKDILVKRNKVYSPDTCIFVPSRINKLFLKNDNVRGEYCVGVTYKSDINKYIARCNTLNERKYLGIFNTEHEAFYIYKEFKEKYIKEVADQYKKYIPKKLYDALYKYQVDITD